MANNHTKTLEPGSPRLARIGRHTVADKVFDELRTAILERQFLPGQRLNIPDIAERFDVSKMPVRQAIGRLADAGLLEIRPRSGTYVAQLDMEDVANTFDVRRALECLAAESAVDNVTDAEVTEIEDLVAQMETAAGQNGDLTRHDRLNTKFHRRLVALSGNEKLIEMYEELNAHIKIARIHFGGGSWIPRVALEQREHRGILRALCDRDGKALVEALRGHIERSKNALTGDLASRDRDRDRS